MAKFVNFNQIRKICPLFFSLRKIIFKISTISGMVFYTE